mgnify:CR=1 FL=1
MTQKLSEYFGLVEKTRNFAEAPDLSNKKAQLRDVNKRSEERRVGKECRARWTP